MLPVAPVIKEGPSNLIVHVGDNVVFPCNIISDFQPIIRWYRLWPIIGNDSIGDVRMYEGEEYEYRKIIVRMIYNNNNSIIIIFITVIILILLYIYVYYY